MCVDTYIYIYMYHSYVCRYTHISPIGTSATMHWLPRYNEGHMFKYQLKNCKFKNNRI